MIVNERGLGSTDIKWVNDLGDTATTQVLAYKYSADQTLHWKACRWPVDGLRVSGKPSAASILPLMLSLWKNECTSC